LSAGARQGERGFALIESLVALAVLAIALSVLLHAGAGAARRLAHAEMLSYATLSAQSLLAASGIETPLGIGTSTGRLPEVALAWRQEVARLPGTPRARAVTISVLDTGGRVLVRLSTVRIAPP
jgi:general secretion pathway protein I